QPAAAKAVSENKLSYQEQKKRDSEKRKLERQVAQAEKQLTELEAKEKEIQQQMADPAIAADFGKLGPLQEDLTNVQEKINEVTQAWEEASLALEDF
ncbi:ABC transporter C-terminal domain-containing protein, partial [Lactobacillus nasalidis]